MKKLMGKNWGLGECQECHKRYAFGGQLGGKMVCEVCAHEWLENICVAEKNFWKSINFSKSLTKHGLVAYKCDQTRRCVPQVLAEGGSPSSIKSSHCKKCKKIHLKGNCE